MSEPTDTSLPTTNDDPGALLALIGAEMVLRLRHGESPDVEDYCRRFPELAESIRQRWAQALTDSDAESPATAAPVLPSAEAILAAAGRLGLVAPEQMQQLTKELAGRALDAHQLGRELLRRGLLAAFQVNQLCQGKESALRVGPYLLLERLGVGGMGQVFKARHGRLGRGVALKLIHPRHSGDQSAAKRFVREVRSLSRLNHPNVVRAVDAGEDNGRPFLVMELVEGPNLAKLVKDKGALPLALACDCARQAALALQHAHEQGLVHRDVKPSNLLLAPDGTVKLLDLGLARLGATSEADAATTLTDTGLMMGTPDYVAPEQIADSKRADIRADLYSLGCTLYHLLTGRPPFAGDSTGQKLVQQQTEEPEAIAVLRPDVPAGLAAVVQKLMAKKPEERYQSPSEVAAVLDQLLRSGKLADGPFGGVAGWAAAPVSWLRRARPSWRGRRLVAAVSVALLLLAAAGAALWLWPRGRPVTARPKEKAPPGGPTLAQLTFSKIRQEERLPTLPPETVQVLGSHQGQHGSQVRCVALHPNGRRAFSGGEDGIVRVWDTATMRQHAALTVGAIVENLAVVLEPRGELILCASTNGELLRWNADTLRLMERVTFSDRSVQCFSPDGRYGLHDYNGDAWLADLRSRQELKRFHQPVPELGYGGMAFTADGKRAFLAVNKGEIAVLETLKGKELMRFSKMPDYVICLAVKPDGKHVLSGDRSGNVWTWEVAGNRVVRHLFLGKPVSNVVLSGDGRRALFLYGKPRRMELWDLENDRKLHPVGREGDWGGVVMSADGRRALSRDGGRVRLWDLDRGEELCHRADNIGGASCVALSPDGRLALTGRPGLFTLYDVVLGKVVKEMPEQPHHILAVAFSRDGRHFAYSYVAADGWTGKLHLYRTETAKEVRSWPLPSFVVGSLVFSGDGRLYGAGGSPGVIRVWDSATGKPAGELRGHVGGICCLAVSPDGDRLLSGGDHMDRTVRLWDLKRGKGPVCFRHPRDVLGVAFAPDGNRAVSIGGHEDGSIRLWDLAQSPETARRPPGGRDYVQLVAFPSEQRIITTSRARQLTAWDLEGRMVEERRLPHQVNALALSKDGKYLATANSNGTAYILRLPLRESR